jgi:hypothetical protein
MEISENKKALRRISGLRVKSQFILVRVYPCPEEELIIMIPAIIIAWTELERINWWKLA